VHNSIEITFLCQELAGKAFGIYKVVTEKERAGEKIV